MEPGQLSVLGEITFRNIKMIPMKCEAVDR